MMPGLGGGTVEIVHPGVAVGVVGLPLNTDAMENLVRTVVDTHLHLPDMFELTFFDDAGTVVSDAGLEIGTKINCVHDWCLGAVAFGMANPKNDP